MTSKYDFLMDLFTFYRRCIDLNVEHEYSRFKGFDVNSEMEFLECVKHIFINEKKFLEQKDHVLNVCNIQINTPMLDKYESILTERQKISQNWEFSLADAQKILQVIEVN